MAETTAGIAELIARIKTDGVQAGQQERERIVAAATQEADAIVAKARNEAELIVRRARSEAETIRAQLKAELGMATRDFSMALGQQLREQVIDAAVREDVAFRLKDPKVLEQVIGEVVGTLAADREVEVVVSEEMREVLVGAAWARIAARARGGIELRGERRLSGFRLVMRGEHIVWDFSDQAIGAELATFVAPQLRQFFALDDVVQRVRQTH